MVSILILLPLAAGTSMLDPRPSVDWYFNHRTMRFDDLSYEGKPQPGASILPCGGAIQLVECFEDVIQMAGWDANARIGDRYNDKIFPFTFDR